jgi:hypothetical protein
MNPKPIEYVKVRDARTGEVVRVDELGHELALGDRFRVSGSTVVFVVDALLAPAFGGCASGVHGRSTCGKWQTSIGIDSCVKVA